MGLVSAPSPASHSAEAHAIAPAFAETLEFRDTQIAGIMLAHRATLAPRNARYFRDLSVDVVDPWG